MLVNGGKIRPYNAKAIRLWLARTRYYSGKQSNGEHEGYMVRRLAALAEEARPLKDDPAAGRPYIPGDDQLGNKQDNPEESSRRQKELIDEIYARVEGSKFNYLNQDKIAYTKIPAGAPKQAREIAESIPWSGTESVHDANLRMLMDVHKPLKPGLAGNVKGTLRPPKFKPPPSRSERLFKARESSLDYTLNKEAGDTPKGGSMKADIEEESGPSFKELYKERLLGPSGIPSAFAAINSLASQRIEDAIARGQFRDIPRGKPLEHDHHTSSPYIDTTEYFLNKIIQRQGAAPPWIEKQIKLNSGIEQFRNALVDRWRKKAVLMVIQEANILLSSDAPATSAEIERAVRIATSYSNIEADSNSTGARDLRDTEWLKSERTYHELMINDINNTIRGYNLQAPGSARKGYLELEQELDLCFKTVAETLPSAVKRYLVPNESMPDDAVPIGLSKDSLHKQSHLYVEDPNNHYGLSHLFKDVVKRVWSKK
ncbi:hypothetical protein AWJ20_2864 [Sugiyamaella lignohabitans]|uniref:DnaJ homologue subfamily C member 28 conserved domain-containing protein n=1 Tax=Sugiyamaella lignohabitans TaxID=796027 RepID=A0A167FFI9_9ASCO|nr:uncharacterized protein AWJ20_2864 [Sugiyamaella lignohabitans]ANB15238.1 hypothetical protein AWJ20_2864 [Sugiyamaella lignohabitans]